MDPYVYPGTNVLRNLRGIRDLQTLARFEADVTLLRLAELHTIGQSGHFRIDHLRGIHQHIFQDVYSWAGEFRTVDMTRSGAHFCLRQYIVSSLDRTLSALQSEGYLHGLGRSQFASRCAHYLGELNAIHPFRDGNGRTQREFLRQLALRNGYRLDWTLITQQQMADASRRSLRKDNNELERLLRLALAPIS